VTGGWRKLRIEVFLNLYSSPRRMGFAGLVARMEDIRNSYKISAGKPEGKRSLGRPRRKCEDNIKMDQES
jgi:hypothetical protein